MKWKIDEAIRHYQDLADGMIPTTSIDEYRQLVQWLETLKEVKRIMSAASYVQSNRVYSYLYDPETKLKHISLALREV